MEAEGKPKSDQFHFYIFYSFFYQVFLIDAYFIMKYQILQKSQLNEAHFFWEYSCLSLHTGLRDVRGVHKNHLSWCSPCSFEVGCYWCLEQQWSYPWAANWRDPSPFLRKFPDICKGKEAFWSFSASTGTLSSIWQSYTTDVQQTHLQEWEQCPSILRLRMQPGIVYLQKISWNLF